MSVQVKTPTKTQFELGGEKFRSPEARGSKDDLNLRVDSNKFSQQWQRKRRYSQTYRREEVAVRRKRIRSLVTEKPVLPNKFLLGGNIDDPLNLNGLYTSEDGRILNERTPQSSPLRTPTHRKTVEVRFPTNIADPLNLNSNETETDISKLCKRKKRHNRHKKKDGIFISPQALSNSNLEKRKDLMEALKIDIEPHSSGNTSVHNDPPKPRKVSDKIVSPVIRQTSPKSKKRRRTDSGSKPEASSAISRALLISPSKTSPVDANKKFLSPKSFSRQASHSVKPSQSKVTPSASSSSKNKKQPKFIYGNYNKYYGYRNPSSESDHRLDSFKSEWFEGKSVLDIGCNVGHLTLSVARDFQPKKIVGIDIDQKLIAAARKNIRYYLSSNVTDTSKFPISHALSYGPIEAPPLTVKDQRFPHNVLFKQGNFVLECDELLDLQKEEYDVILALSITKWIHFNWGDTGLKRFFKRIFRQLKPGGKLILEPQPWSSYKKKKKLTEKIYENFQSIKLKPDQFNDYLLSKEVGFSTCSVIDVPFNSSKGFRRTLQLFTKSDTVQNSPYPDISYSHIHVSQSAPCLLSENPLPDPQFSDSKNDLPYYSGTEDPQTSISGEQMQLDSDFSHFRPSESATSIVSEHLVNEDSRDSYTSSSSYCSTCDGSSSEDMASPDPTRSSSDVIEASQDHGNSSNVASSEPNGSLFSISQTSPNLQEEEEAVFKSPRAFTDVHETADDSKS